MSRGKRQLSDAFEKFEDKKEVQEPHLAEETPQEATEEVVEPSQSQEQGQDSTTLRDVTEQFKSKYEKKVSRPTVEDTHIRTTFLFRKDLQKRLDRLARNKRGYKTEFINTAIEALLNDIENS